MKTIFAQSMLVLSLVAWPLVQAHAQSAAASHAAHAHAHAHAVAAPAQAGTSARQALDQSMARMHDDMMRGIAHDDADVAFAAGMLAHHQGAVEMAGIQLQYGQDPAMRQLAAEVVRAQEAELLLLKAWLTERGLSAAGQPLMPSAPHAGH